RLALAYRDAFGENASWPAICALGRQMTPNLLDGVATDDKSIGDDLVERWLGVPLDFTAHLLANELHAQLMDTYSGGKRRKRRTDSLPRSPPGPMRAGPLPTTAPSSSGCSHASSPRPMTAPSNPPTSCGSPSCRA